MFRHNKHVSIISPSITMNEDNHRESFAEITNLDDVI